MSLTKEQSDAVFEATVELRKTLQWSSYNLGYAPELMTAMACGAALCGLGIQNLIVAGSALWLVMSEEDQGDAMIEGRKVHPFFGFKFDMTKELAKLMTLKYPDEIHVWCQDEDGCIYDMSGPSIMESYEAVSEQKWPESSRLPKMISGTSEDLAADGWFYKKDEKATELMVMVMHKLSMHMMSNLMNPDRIEAAKSY